MFSFLKRNSKTEMNQDSRFWESSSFSRSLFQRFINPTKAQINVTSENAYHLSPYWLAVRAISEDIAKLPIRFFTSTKDGKKEIFSSPLLKTLKTGFNNETDSMTGIQTMIQWVLTFGNAYAEIQRNSLGDIELTLIHPSRVIVKRDASGELVYHITMSTEVDRRGRNQTTTLTKSSNDIFHFKGPGNGVVGYSIGEIAAESLGISLAAQDFTGAFFGNNLSIGAVLETDKALKADEKTSIRKEWKKLFGGSKNVAEMAILDRGFKFNRLQMSSTDAELLKTRKFQVEEIARWFRIPPHKLMDMSKTAFNNVEQQDINYSTDTLSPWIRRLEVQLKHKFHRNDNTVIDIDEKALLRGDTAARTSYYKELWNMGGINTLTISQLEGLPKPDNGELYYTPLNVKPVNLSLESDDLDNEVKRKSLEEPQEQPEPAPEVEEKAEDKPADETIEEKEVAEQGISEQVAVAAYLPSMKDSLSRLTRKEDLSHQAAAKKDDTAMIEHLNKFYVKYESELKDCLQIHANFLCNVLNKDKMTDIELVSLSQSICQMEKDDNRTDTIIENLLTSIGQSMDAPQLKEIRLGEDGKNYVFTTKGWRECEVI